MEDFLISGWFYDPVLMSVQTQAGALPQAFPSAELSADGRWKGLK